MSGKKRLAALVAGGALSMGSLLGASLARADTTITRRAGGVTVEWEVETSSGDRIEVTDATLTTTGGGLSRDDAFDGALELWVYGSTDTSSNIGATTRGDDFDLDADATVVDNSPNGGSVSGTAVAAFGGNSLSAVWSLVFSAAAAQVDGTFTVTNDGASPFNGFLSIDTNFGSDGSTVVEATSSGDTVVTDADTWVVTSEGSGEASGDDPVILSTVTSPGAVLGPDTDLVGDDDLIWRFPVSLAPGQSITISAQHCLFETISEAVAAGQSGRCGGATAVPAVHNPGLLALAVLTGLIGTGALRRRARKQRDGS